MSALRSMGLSAALLAATGGVALATWRYLSARRQKSAEHSETLRVVEEEGNVEVVSPQDEEPGTFRISEQCEDVKQELRAGTAEEVSAVHNEEGKTRAQGSDGNAPPGTSPVCQKEKNAAAPVTSRTAEEKSAAAPVTSMTTEEKSAADPVTSRTAEEKSAAAPVTSMTAEEKRAADPVTSMTEEDKSAADPITSMTAEEKRAADPVTSMTAEEKRAAAPVTYMTAEEKRAAAPVTSRTAEEKRAADPVTSRTAEEKSAADPVTYMTAEEKSAAAPVTYMTAEEKSAAAPVTYMTAEEKRAADPVSSMAAEEHAPRSSVDLPMEKGISDSLSYAETEHKEKHAPCKQVLVLGLDGAGKTSILNSIAANKGKLITTPTEGINAMCVSNGNSKMEFLEIGGSEQLRPYWKMYLARAFAVIFVVDSADHDRLPLAKRHLYQLIQQDSDLPLLVLANKQDLENAHHIPEIHDALALSEICEKRKLFLIGTYVTKEGSEVSSGIQDTKEFLAHLFLENSAEIK